MNFRNAISIAALAVATASVRGDTRSCGCPEVPQVKVRFAHFRTSTTLSRLSALKRAGSTKSEFRLTRLPTASSFRPSEASAVFASGRVDVMSASAQLFLPAAPTLPPYKVFHYADIFQGYAIMAQPDGGGKIVPGDARRRHVARRTAFMATSGSAPGHALRFPDRGGDQGIH